MLPEPLGGAHRDSAAMSATLKHAITRHLRELTSLPAELLLEQRQARIAAFGVYSEGAA